MQIYPKICADAALRGFFAALLFYPLLSSALPDYLDGLLLLCAASMSVLSYGLLLSSRAEYQAALGSDNLDQTIVRTRWICIGLGILGSIIFCGITLPYSFDVSMDSIR